MAIWEAGEGYEGFLSYFEEGIINEDGYLNSIRFGPTTSGWALVLNSIITAGNTSIWPVYINRFEDTVDSASRSSYSPYEEYTGFPTLEFIDTTDDISITYSSTEAAGLIARYGISDNLKIPVIINNGIADYAENMDIATHESLKTFKKVPSKPFKLHSDSLFLETKMEIPSSTTE